MRQELESLAHLKLQSRQINLSFNRHGQILSLFLPIIHKMTSRKPKLQFDYVYVNFYLWIEKWGYLFAARPYIRKRSKTYFFISFEGVDDIQIVIHKNWKAHIFTFCRNKNLLLNSDDYFDVKCEFDIREIKDSNGYYFSDMDPKEFYKTRDALWNAKLYIPILAWANRYIRPDMYLCVIKREGEHDYDMQIQCEDGIHAVLSYDPARYLIYRNKVIQDK